VRERAKKRSPFW